MRPSPFRSWKILLVGGAFLAGCAPQAQPEDAVDESEQAAVNSFNGLSSINGLTSYNGLSSMNCLSAFNGLSSYNGLADGIGLMSSDPGRSTVSYLVRCALPKGRSITKKDQYGRTYTFAGQIGVAPQWEYGACDRDCQEHISACVLAHVNTTGKNIDLWIDGDSPAIGWGRSSNHPYQEGSFFGNIFESPPKAYFCNGKDHNHGVVPGRLGNGKNGAPYQNPFGDGAYCKDRCTAADYPNSGDGYKACNGFNHVVTVWRNFDPNTEYKVCARHSGKCLDVEGASTADNARLAQYGVWGGANQKWRIRQVSPGKYTFTNVRSGKNLDISGGWTGNGAALIQWTPTGSTNQQWSFTPKGDGYFKFSPGSQPNASLDVPYGSQSDGVRIQQWSWSWSNWQQWNILPAN